MSVKTKKSLLGKLKEILILEGYTLRTASNLLGVELERFMTELEKALKAKVLAFDEAESLKTTLSMLRKKAKDKDLRLLEGFFSSLLLELSEKEVGKEVPLYEYIKCSSFSRNSAIKRFSDWARKRFSKVAVLKVERPVPEKLGEAVKKYGPFELRRDAENPNRFLVVGSIYRKDKGKTFKLLEKKVIGEIEVEP